MNEPSGHDALNARVFRAFSRALRSEGFDDDEACQLARRGAELLTAPDPPSGRCSDKPSGAAQGLEAADKAAPAPDRPFLYFFSNPVITRRLSLAALAVCVGIGAFTFFKGVLELARSPRTPRSVGSSTVSRYRELHVAMFLISVLLVIVGLFIFAAFSW